MKQYDFVVVGGGLAGSLLTWFILKKGKTCCLVDNALHNSSSLIAPGLIMPITGRRLAKTWMFDTAYPFAVDFYKHIGLRFNTPVFQELNTLEIMNEPVLYNNWISRSKDKGMQELINTKVNHNLYETILNPGFLKVEVCQSGRVDLNKLLATMHKYLLEINSLIQSKVNGDDIIISHDGLQINEIKTGKIIFCEGASGRNNPYWSFLPFIPSKGETIIFTSEFELNHILNRKVSIVPLGNKMFQAGSTYTWTGLNTENTSEARTTLMNEVSKIIRKPFTVVSQHNAIRPTVKNRRPFIGLHADNDRIGIFNGLGTKGCLLAPFMASHFADHLMDKTPLLEEVDVRLLCH